VEAAPTEIIYPSVDWGETGTDLYVRVQGVSSDVISRTNVGVAEHPAASGIYRATLTAPAEGQYQIIWDDGVVYATDDLRVIETSETDVSDIADDVAEIKSIIASSVIVSAPVAAGGEVTVVQGDDYTGARALVWTSTTWPDLTAGSVHLEVGETTPPSLDKPASSVLATEVKVSLVAGDTLILFKGMYQYRLVHVNGLVEQTLAAGRFFVV
jgi:hypothetical protein